MQQISNGLFESATMHVNGLLEILANLGPRVDGLLPLENVWLQKVVAGFVFQKGLSCSIS